MTNFMDQQFAAEDALIALIDKRLAHHREVDAAATGQRGPVPVAETLVVGQAAVELAKDHDRMVVANAAGMIGETLALVMMDATGMDREQVMGHLAASMADYRQRSDAWYQTEQVGPPREQLFSTGGGSAPVRPADDLPDASPGDEPAGDGPEGDRPTP